jgi:hypothetical protein
MQLYSMEWRLSQAYARYVCSSEKRGKWKRENISLPSLNSDYCESMTEELPSTEAAEN